MVKTGTKWAVLVACMLGGTLSANAVLLYLDDALGTASDGSPADPVSEAEYVNNLLGVEVADGTVKIGRDYYTRINDNPRDPMPEASADGALRDDNPNNYSLFWSTAYDYLVAKYGGGKNGGDYIWYVGDLQLGETYELPATAFGTKRHPNGYGLSHVSLYNPTTVPDAGQTLLLLGMALTAYGAFRFRCR